jgi:AraC-like DNA-binding protein/mannose-6-phosphate isomerase-like protein (cupin superfamily)
MANSSRTPKRRSTAPAKRQAIEPTQFDLLSRLPIATDVGGHHANVLYSGVLAKKWWRNYLHMHSFFEVCHVFAGEGTFLINGTKHEIRPGDTLIARPREAHEIVSSRRHPLGIYFWAYTLTPNSDQPKPGADDSLFELLRQFPSSTPSIVRVEGLDQVLKLMTLEVVRAAPGYLEMVNDLAGKTIVDVARAALPNAIARKETDARNRTFGESVVQTVIQYLGDNLSRRFEVRDVAAQVNLSERQLRRVFVRFAGTTILDYLTNLRIERAGQMLLNTELPIKQIAASVGYPDTHYFTTVFGREKGTTPGAFRQSHGTEFPNRHSRRPARRPRPA